MKSGEELPLRLLKQSQQQFLSASLKAEVCIIQICLMSGIRHLPCVLPHSSNKSQMCRQMILHNEPVSSSANRAHLSPVPNLKEVLEGGERGMRKK